MVDRPHEARHVAERTALEPSLGEGPIRPSFEVHEDEVLTRVKDVVELVVAVDPDPPHVDLAGEERAHARPQRGLEREDSARETPRLLGEVVEPSPQPVEHVARGGEERLLHRALVEQGEGLGGKCRVLDRSERSVELRRAAAEQLREPLVGTEDLAEGQGRRLIGSRSGPRRRREVRALREGPLEEVGDRVARVAPGVPLVRHEPVNEGDGAWLGAPRRELERAEEGTRAREGSCREDPADLEVGVHARLDPPEELEHEALTEPHGGGVRCFGRGGHGPALLRDGRERSADGDSAQLAHLGAEPRLASDHPEERREEGPVAGRVDEQRLGAGPGRDASDRHRRDVLLARGREAEGDDVDLGLALAVGDLDEEHPGGLCPRSHGERLDDLGAEERP